MVEIKILIILEGSKDVKVASNFLKNFLKEKLSEEKFKNIKIEKDTSNEETIKITPKENFDVIICFKTSVGSNIKDLTTRIAEYGSLEKMYNIESRYFTYVYIMYDLDLGSTNSTNIEEFLSLIELSENIYPIIFYPGYEGEIYNYYYTNILREWENIKIKTFWIEDKDKNKKNYCVDNFIFNESEIFTFNSEDKNITSVIKIINRKILESLSIKSISLKEIEQNYFQCLERYFPNEYSKRDTFYFIQNQKEIFKKQKPEGMEEIKIKIVSFLLVVFYEILLQIEDE